MSHFPPWLRQKISANDIKTTIRKHGLTTICEEAKCPNLFHCYQNRRATFLVLGNKCSRNCLFCNLETASNLAPPNPKEPLQIAACTQKMGLKHVVITMVTRDDLEDGGASHLAKVIRALKKIECSIEVLTSDFQGKGELIDIVLNEKPDIFNHNLETVLSLSPLIRPMASYHLSLKVLKYAKTKTNLIKSGIMLGLGESFEEARQTIKDLSFVDILTIGQYLQPNPQKYQVKKFILPEEFLNHKNYALSLGIKEVFSSPFVRSSFAYT